MSKKMKKGWTVFSTMFQVGCIGFGGGNALIPVLHQKVVEEQKLVTEEEFEEDVMMASITPGALPVEIAGGIGHRVAGVGGMLLGCYGMALPGVLATLMLLVVFSALSEMATKQIQFVTVGVAAFICILLLDYVIGCFRKEAVASRKKYDAFVILLVFILTGEKNLYRILGITITPLFSLATIDVFIIAFFLIACNAGKRSTVVRILSIVLSGMFIALKGKGIPLDSKCGLNCLLGVMALLGLLQLGKEGKKVVASRRKIRQGNLSRCWDILALAAVVVVIVIPSVFFVKHTWEFVGKGLVSSLISFGGGDAYLTVADGMFVEPGLLSEEHFYSNLVPIVNVLPGSILCKTLSGVGFYLGTEVTNSTFGGILVAVLGFSVSVFASVGIFSLVHEGYSVVSQIPMFVQLKDWIRPIVSGLMMTVMTSLLYQARRIHTGTSGWCYVGVMLVLFIVGSCLYHKKVGNVKIIMGLVAGALLCCNGLQMMLG